MALSRNVWLLGVTILLCSMGCDLSSQEVELSTTELHIESQEKPRRPAEDLPMLIASTYPNFAGYYCSAGDLNVGVTANATPSEVGGTVAQIQTHGIAFYCASRENDGHIPQIVTVEKRYSFIQLTSWRDAIRVEFKIDEGALGIGIDYDENKILVDVRFGYSASEQVKISSLSIPDDAVAIREREAATPTVACPPPPYSGTGLRNCFRPVLGGVQMEPSLGGDCTLTVGGFHPGTGELGWVTASHCLGTQYFGQNAGQFVYQFDFTDGAQFIGSESLDPPTFGCTPLGGYQPRCRYSDSTWIRHGTGGVFRGQLAQTQSWLGNTNCCTNGCAACQTSLTSPRFQIYGTAAPLQGMTVEKIGRSTGWTTGEVSVPCHDEPDGEGRWLICQVVTNLITTGGDSGSPIFYWWSSYGVNTVELVGLLWGADSNGTYGSPWANIAADLGSIDVKYTPQWQDITALYSQYANDIGVGGSATQNVWITTNTPTFGGYTIKRWNGNGWDSMPDGGLRIAVDPTGKAWMIDQFGYIFRWLGSDWQQVPGTARDIGIGANGSVWIVGTSPTGGGYVIYSWNGSGWTLVSGGAVRIAVDPAGYPWITANDYTIWRLTGGGWQQIPGAAVDIGVGPDGMVWVLGTAATGGGYQIFWWSGLNWVLAPGGATAISVDRGGIPWVVNNVHQVFRAL